MTLHPRARAAVAGRQRTVLSDRTLARVRREVDEATATVPGPPLPVPVTEVDANGVPGRLYLPQPAGSAAVPVLLYLHGGGWTTGSAAGWDAPCRRIALVSGWAVLSLDYRLAPEHPYPAAVDDVDAALTWLRGPAARYGIDGGQVAVGGDSAGAYLATVAAGRARDRHEPLVCQILVYPALDPGMSSLSYTTMNGYMLDRTEMEYFWTSFLPGSVDRTDPAVTPLRADLTGLPPALVLTAEYDVLRDEGESYAALLAEAGVPVTATRYCGMVHGFFRRPALYDAATGAADQVGGFLRGRSTTPPQPVAGPLPSTVPALSARHGKGAP
ncbi:alpha/beta hydrolase [Micromonospora echinofusca]|uniref:Alpha/beta hydrolase fold domain-containing protein n=1 Tax=Micromonospora echinofusca TaxID=47858 RepID=A0ABS3VZT7_MICEH|nr:alpha/beta hydrolase [Micromonospora echinofusca]MBO4210042.1 alpha/beta hydrolase fold domain-containing protein [Micromonospora echinofusca]